MSEDKIGYGCYVNMAEKPTDPPSDEVLSCVVSLLEEQASCIMEDIEAEMKESEE